MKTKEALIDALSADITSVIVTMLGHTPNPVARAWAQENAGTDVFRALAVKHVSAAQEVFTPDADAIDWETHEAAMRRANHGRAHNLDSLHGVLLQQAQKAFGRPDTTDEKMRLGG